MTLSVVLSFFSYIKVSPAGIEQKNALYKHIRSYWMNVDKLGKYILLTDVIYLNAFEVIGPSLSLKSPFRYLRPRQGFISLTGYKGWPVGELANNLKRYAPQLFESQSILEETSEENKSTQGSGSSGSDIKQEDRLFAALSNASIMFSTLGMIVPILIYAVQRKKIGLCRLSSVTGIHLANDRICIQHTSIIVHGRWDINPCSLRNYIE